MGIVKRDEARTGPAFGTSLNVDIPTHNEGEILIIHLAIDSASVTPTTPAGWTLTDSNVGADSIYVYTTTATSSQSDPETINGSGGSSWFNAVATSWYDDAGLAVTIDVSADQSNASGTYEWPTVTPTDDPGLLLLFASIASTVRLTPPAAATQIYEYDHSTSSLFLMTQPILRTAATGTVTATLETGPDQTNRVVSLALLAPVGPISRDVDAIFGVDWGGNDVFEDEIANLISINGQTALAPPGQSITATQGIISRAQATLHNNDQRYSALRTDKALSSALTSGLAYHAPCYFSVSDDGGSNYYRVFTGVIKIPQEGAPTVGNVPTITLEMRGPEEQYLNERISTTGSQFRTNYTGNGVTEAELMAQWLAQAGLSASDYTLDDGLYIIPFAWLDDESVIEACWQLAAACGGRFYADADGEFVYENAAHWTLSPHDTSQIDLRRNNWKTFAPAYGDNDLNKTISVTAAVYDIGDTSTLYESREPIIVKDSETVTVTARLSAPAYEVAAITYNATTPAGVDKDSDITLTSTEYVQRVELEFENTGSDNLYISNIKVMGKPVLTSAEITREEASTDTMWTSKANRTRRIANNKFMQTPGQATALASFLVDRQGTPTLFFTVQGTKGDPQLRLGDRVNVFDVDVMSTKEDAMITGLQWQYSRSTGFSQTVTAVQADGLFAQTSYFIINTNKLGTSGSGVAQLFY